MGTDLMRWNNQRKNAKGEWVDVDDPEGFDITDGRSYSFFGWLAGVRNYSAVTPLAELRGLPDDILEERKRRQEESWQGGGFGSNDPDDYDNYYSNYGWGWLLVDEIRAVDFDAVIEDRRVTIDGNGGRTCEPGQGQFETLREFLGEYYMRNLELLMASDVERVVFAFD